MSSTEPSPKLEDFDFIEIHSLSHKFSHPHTPDSDKSVLAEKALHLMDKYQALHPCHQQMCTYLQSINSDQISHFGEEWIIAIRDHTTTSNLSNEDTVFSSNKEKVLLNIVPLLKSSFVRADFHMLEYYLNKLNLSTQFPSNVYDDGSFAKNRYFEFAFYQILCVLFGQFWFHDLNAGENPDAHDSANSTSDTLDWTVIEKKADLYFASCESIPDFSLEKLPEGAESSELDFYWAIKWCCVFIKFKENRFNEFVESFQAIKHNLAVLESLNLHSEALVFYAIACIATRPFKDLTFSSEDDLVDFYTSSSLITTNIYQLLEQLSVANFVEAKNLFKTDGYLSTLDSSIEYALPAKTVGTFWDALEVIIDSKVFLMIMSMTKYIPRAKMLEKMGYAEAEQTVKDSVSNNMVLLISVLSLGKANVYYHQEDDRFCNLPIENEAQVLDLQEQLAKVDHTIKAEAIATQMRGLLVSNFFKDLKDSQD